MTQCTADFWRGEFGQEYTTRNRVQWRDRVPFFERMLLRTQARSWLDVGCNAGWNLRALRAVDPGLHLTGVDINVQALAEAREAGFDVRVALADEITDVLGLRCAEVVVTSGVLIHVAPEDLLRTMTTIRDASTEFVLCVEYPADEETEVEYRGHAGKLWKRPFGKLYQALGMELLESGHAEGFDRCDYWLLAK